MGKPKKGKKGRQDEEFGDDDADLDPLAKPGQEEETAMPAKSIAPKGKKGKKKKNDDDWEDDVAAELAALSLQQKAGEENDDINGEVEEVMKQQKPKKKDKKKGKKVASSEEEDNDEDNNSTVQFSSNNMPKKGAGMSAFAMLMDDDDSSAGDISEEEIVKPSKPEKKNTKQQSLDDEQENQEEKAPQQQSKKKGKKEKKKKKDDSEDIDALLAEIEGKTAPEKGIEFKDISSMTPDEIAKTMEAEYDDEDDKRKKKKKKGGKEEEAKDKKIDGEEQEEGVDDDEDEEEDEEGGTVKTAAQKKKEKKERQKQKKLEEKAKEKKNKKNKENKEEVSPVEKTETESSVAPAKPDVSTASETTTVAAEGNEEKPAEDEDAEKDDKKKNKRDKKKKKEKEEEKEKEKKKPTSKMAKMILEQQKKIQEEEERIRIEMEEKERKLDEAFQEKREAELKIKEKKEKEKQKKREKIERQKKEGTFLTAKQKEAQKRAQLSLEAMKAQGYEVPTSEDVPKKKKPVYDKKKKKPQTQTQSSQEDTESLKESTPEEETKPVIHDNKAPEIATETKVEKKEAEEIKDSWDISDEEEEKEEPKAEEDVKQEEHKEGKKKSRMSESSSTRSRSEAETEEDEEEDEEEGSSDGEDGSSEEESSEEDSETSSDEDDGLTLAEKVRAKALARIQKRKDDAEKKCTTDLLRAAVVVVLGHVDTGKTKILDKLRRTNVQDNEAGGITQQIGATNVPVEAIKDATKMCKEFSKAELKLPGLLIIDTPGHESFSNLRSRGSSLCDIAILVVDIMHGLEPQTIESINLLKERKTPFVVALNKIDRLYQWQPNPHSDVSNVIKKQKSNTKLEFDERAQQAIVQLAEQGLNAKLFYENKNPKEYISLVPTSAHSGDGMGNLVALVCELTQAHLAKRLAFSEDLHATVMEVKALPGLGTTIDVILVNGTMKEGDTIIVPGSEGPIVTQIRGLLMPQPMRELRVKNAYEHHKSVMAAQGVKIIAKDLDKALAGLPVYIAHFADEIDIFKEEVSTALEEVLGSIKLSEKGVYVQASTLGSLEALLQFLNDSKIPYAGINIGPVHKRDVMKLSVMLDRDPQYGVMLAFDVKVERDAQDMADNLGLRIFTAEIIYHLFDAFTAYREEYKKAKQEEFKHIAVFPCKLRVLPQHIYNSRDPIVMGVSVEAGFLKMGTLICVPSKEFIQVGVVTSIEINHKQVDKATKGQEVCIKLENPPGETPKLYGRHFDHTDHLISKISRESIDAVKNYFRDEMTKTDWQLIVELKQLFEIL